MMVTIHGLPVNIKYQDLKAMIKQECKISDFILDNLVCDTDGFRKVRVGLADDIEGAHVIKCLNGYRLSGYILRVAPVGKSGVLNQANQLNQRGFQSQSYQGQTQSDYGRADQPRVDPWSSSQWSANQPIAQPQQNSYGYQQTQQMNTYSPANVNQAIRPQYDQRQSILSRIGPPSQGFAFAPKNEVPTQAAAPVRQGVLRAVDIVDTSHMANRHVGSYDVSRERSDMARDRPELARERSDMARDRSDMARDRSDMARDRSDMARNRIDMARDRPDMTRGRPDMSRENVIMKDHFQGPEYGSPQQGSSYYQDRNPWAQQQKLGDDRKFSADKREIVKEPLIKHSGSYKDYDKGQFSPQPRIVGTGRNISPTGKRMHQSGRDISPPGRQIPQSRVSPSGRRISPSGRRVSPPGRRNSPPGRRISPSGRRISPPGRRISPSGRRISPPGRRISPSGRRISPPGRRISPGRHASPHSTIHKEQAKRNLPGRQSPDRRDEGRRLPPGQERYSPTHIEEIRPAPKQVRPAYEPPSASNQPIYSGGYRPNINENVQYPQGRPDRWSDRVKPFIKHEEDRREPRMSKFDSQRGVDHPVPEGTKRARSQNRESRSPKRDRSPIRDRYRRHSPSPRSPRRSWALEKRRSPDDNEAPPPPSWPGQDPRGPDSRDKRQSYPDRTGEARPPTWEIPKFEPKTEDIRREPRAVAEEKRHFDRETIAVRKDLMKWKPISTDGPKHPSSRYNPDDNEKDHRRKEYEGRQQEFRMQDDGDRRGRPDRREFAERHEHEDRRYKSNYTDANDLTQIKEELSRRIEKKTEILKKQEELQKEIEDVYKRAVDFTKKAEMYKKGDRRHEEDYRDERRQDQHESKHYDRNVDRFDQERRNRDEIAKKPYIERNRDDFRPEDRNLEEKNKIRRPMSPSQKAKRDKAGEEISEKLLSKYGSHLPEDIKTRVIEEIKFAVSKIFFEMFGNDEVSFIEMVVKFNSKHNIKDQEKIFDEVMKSFPSQYRKRPAQDESGIPSKTSKPSPTPVTSKATIRKMPVKYPTKALPQRSPTLRTAEHKKLDIKSRPEVVKQKTDETARKTKTEESQKTGRKDDEVPNEDAADTTAVKKETDESIQEMFPEDIPETERELDPLTTRLLEYELRHIMIKVWQEFPDDPPTDDEKLVAEKFRNEAGDDIRNVIGLNVTKRLLNIYNRLIVKVRFSSRPEKSYLLAFLKKYKIRGFKRVASEINTFAAQLKTIEDFDRICAEKVISCGNAKLTITPCYTFMKCPPKLKTKFVDEADDKDEEKENPQVKSDTNNDEEESKKIDKVATEEKAGEKKNDNKDQIENTTTKANPVRLEVKEADIKPKEVNKPKVINKPDTSKPGNIQTPDKETAQKSEVKKVTNAKIAQPKENSVGKINENKTDETEKSVGLTAEKNKETAKNETINNPKAKQAIVPKSVKAKIEPPTNNIPTKTVPTTKTPQKFTKPTAVAKRINKAKETAKVPSKKIQSGKDKSKDIKTVKNQSKMGVIEKYDDYDEMDDEDILALLSEGVVLDECGSDDE